MEVQPPYKLQEKLDCAAAENNSGAEEYATQFCGALPERDAWFRQQVKQGLDRPDRGEFLTHEKVGARIEQTFRP